MLRLGILGSTSGTDMQAIIDAIGKGKLNAKIKLVISNKQEAYILKRAQKNNILNKYISDKNLDRDRFGELITKNFIELNVDIILLIGFMKILSDSFCLKWKDKILNVHPSLLPKYAGGMNNGVHEQVLKNKEDETGCTIHYVTEEVDSGPILIQKKCSVLSNDSVETLKKRVQQLEGEAFIEALNFIEKKNHA